METKLKGKYSQFFWMKKKLEALGDSRDRDEIIMDFTGGLKSSLKELTEFEYHELLRVMSRSISTSAKRHDKEDTKRKRVIALLCNSGFTINNKADMLKINQWCVSHGHLHKPLDHYKGQDLSKLIVQAEEMYYKFLERL